MTLAHSAGSTEWFWTGGLVHLPVGALEGCGGVPGATENRGLVSEGVLAAQQFWGGGVAGCKRALVLWLPRQVRSRASSPASYEPLAFHHPTGAEVGQRRSLSTGSSSSVRLW